MAKTIDKSNLGYLDLSFQYKLVKIFVEDAKFFEDIASIVDQNAFTEQLLRKIVGTLKDYYANSGCVPSYETVCTILKSKATTNIELEEIDAVIKKLKVETSYEGYDIVKENALRFFKQQNLIRVANKILEIAGKGDLDKYEECKKLLDDASTIGQDDDLGFNIFDYEEKALSNDYTISIPTGIKHLDDVLGGGLDKGKLGLIIAPTGFGKTSFTTAICANAASYKCDINNNMGFKVLQIYFEDDNVDITRKHFSKITQIEARKLKRLTPDDRDEVASLLENYEDKELLRKNLRLKKFKTGQKSATDIENFVKKLINSGFKPDLISIDYFECLAHEKGGGPNDTEWTKEGATMRKLENMAQDFDCAIWVPTQGNKESINATEFVRLDQAGGSMKKIHVPQVVISIARALKDIELNRAVVSILKNRAGSSGKVFNNVIFNNGTCTIDCTEIETFTDPEWDDEFKKRIEEERNEKLRFLSTKQIQDYNSGSSHGNVVGYVGQQSH